MFTPPVRGRRSPSAYRQFLSLSLAALLIFSGSFAFSVSRFGVVYADTGTGSVLLGALNTTVGPENFNSLANTGTANTTLPAGWYITETGGGARDNEAYGADNGGSSTADTYSYGSGTTTPSTERALGGLRSGTLVPVFGAKFTNNTGTLVNTLDITYTGEEWRLGTASRTDRLDFQISTDATDLSTGTYNNVDSLDFTTPVTATIGAKDGNAAANRTVITATISNLNIPSGSSFFIRWTDLDASGADDGLAVDDFSITPRFADVAPTVSSTTPSNSATGVSSSSNITITFSEPVNAAAAAFTINCATSGAHTFVLSGGPTTFTLNPDTDFSPNEVCTVTVDDAQVTDQDSVDPPDKMAADFVFSFTTADTAACGTTFTPTYTIQGSGPATPIPGSATTEGIVVGDFQGSAALSGFYIQDPGGDANTATSDGLYVFDGGTPSVDIAVGDRVRVTGTVSEFNGKTEITPGTVIVCSTGNPLPPPTVIDLPEPVNNDLERYEHMLAIFPETLTVTGNFNLGRFGELVLSSDGREFQETNFNRPNSPGALATRDLNERRYVVLDDGRATSNPDPTPYFDANNTRRTGDTVANLTGILTFDFSEYRVEPTVAPTFAAS
ncbi:MAG: Ig-like domain-containing protein, partial [Acidobacteria bacterium]|nr:Ig-like domain-containing protein [Acidobacteriota bacterium]